MSHRNDKREFWLTPVLLNQWHSGKNSKSKENYVFKLIDLKDKKWSWGIFLFSLVFQKEVYFLLIVRITLLMENYAVNLASSRLAFNGYYEKWGTARTVRGNSFSTVKTIDKVFYGFKTILKTISIKVIFIIVNTVNSLSQ